MTHQIEGLILRLRYLGVAVEKPLEEELLEKINSGKPTFDIFFETSFAQDARLEALLFFYKNANGFYHLYKHRSLLNYLKQPEKNRSREFELEEAEITLKEAFNLLQGRAVEKFITFRHGDRFLGWLTLNFKERDDQDNYKYLWYRSGKGYSLDKAVSLYPIREVANSEGKAKLERSLRHGNLHLVNFVLPGKTEQKLVAANPKHKNLYIYSKIKGSFVGQPDWDGTCAEDDPVNEQAAGTISD